MRQPTRSWMRALGVCSPLRRRGIRAQQHHGLVPARQAQRSEKGPRHELCTRGSSASRARCTRTDACTHLLTGPAGAAACGAAVGAFAGPFPLPLAAAAPAGLPPFGAPPFAGAAGAAACKRAEDENGNTFVTNMRVFRKNAPPPAETSYTCEMTATPGYQSHLHA